MSDTTLQDVTNSVAAGNAGMYKRIVPQWMVFRSQQSGEILMVNGTDYFWISDMNVLNLFRVVGAAEEETRNYDDNVNAWIKTLDDATETVHKAIKDDTGEIRRQVGVLLGLSDGKEGTSEQQYGQMIRSTSLQCVRDSDPAEGGAIYAVGARTFYHLVSMDELNALRAAGVLSQNIWDVGHDTIVMLQKVIKNMSTIEGVYSPPTTAPPKA